MGSIAFRVDRSESTLDILKRRCMRFDDVPENERPEIVGTAEGSGFLAVALRYPAAYLDKHSGEWWRQTFQVATDGSITSAVIFQVDRREMAGTNFCYKDVGETSGPYQVVGPRFLALLSPIIGDGNSAQYAKDWREKCLAAAKEAAETRRKVAKITDGCRVKLPAPLRFSNGVAIAEAEGRTNG